MPCMIKVGDLRKSFGSLEVLKAISLERDAGSVTAVIGPSGSGKSTLLRCLNLLTTPDSGSITIGDVSVALSGRKKSVPAKVATRLRRSTGMVFQHFNLFPHMTALQNVMEGPRTVKGLPAAQCRDIAQGYLAKVGLIEKADSYPANLSGGQKQRVAIARALAPSPRILIADEPTGNLDQATGRQVADLLFAKAAERGMTLVLVTHDPALAARCSRQVSMRSGRIEDASSLEVTA